MIDIEKIRKSVGIVGESELIRDMLMLIGQVADTNISVLIDGESGTGKEMVAKAIHKNSRRKFEPMVTVNCGAIPAGIIESELFGHKKGSFTGATEERKGYFETAHKGTIFLDEIGETPIETQAKLLRVIEQGEFMRVGGSKTERVDTRVIAATNRELTNEVRKEKFRKDLYFRLKTITIKVPPLRDHTSDIHLFIERFGLEFCAKNDIVFRGFVADAIKVMRSYHWPGNIRELKNLVESLIVIHRGERITEDQVRKSLGLNVKDINMNLPILIDGESDKMERELILKQLLYVRQDVNEIKQLLLSEHDRTNESMYPANSALYLPPTDKKVNAHIPSGEIQEVEEGRFRAIRKEAIGEITITDLEHEMIERTLEKFNDNRRKTARALDISERTLYRKISEYGIRKN
ncbi:MAG: sigma-54-dependent Fis family transcriptional regulator [Candidatus Marinimicrobia bacterium]|nr:sigma-54-dependent Fis family transcriptional regulator [Candidatus Neomarinimicrobiota bacterium]